MKKSLVINLLIYALMLSFAAGASGEKPAGSGHPAALKARLGVSMLSPNGVDEKTAGEISEKLYAKINGLRSGQVVYRAKGLDPRSVNRILTGRISRLGSSLIIAISVLDGEKGNVLYNSTATIRAADSVDIYLDRVSREINRTGTVWE